MPFAVGNTQGKERVSQLRDSIIWRAQPSKLTLPVEIKTRNKEIVLALTSVRTLCQTNKPYAQRRLAA
jgi:hypothetical protein